jgi:Flp pilus assembly protein TadB
MEWLLLAAFGIMWAALLVPIVRKRSEARSVQEFETRMELLAHAGVHGTSGRWIVTPRKGIRFLGPQERQRARARERRRRVFVFLLESIGLTVLIGLVPPLRAAWYVSAALGALLLLYVWALLSIKHRAAHPHDVARAARVPEREPQRPAPARYVADGRLGWARPTFNGLGALDESDAVHVVVRPASAASV